MLRGIHHTVNCHIVNRISSRVVVGNSQPIRGAFTLVEIRGFRAEKLAVYINVVSLGLAVDVDIEFIVIAFFQSEVATLRAEHFGGSTCGTMKPNLAICKKPQRTGEFTVINSEKRFSRGLGRQLFHTKLKGYPRILTAERVGIEIGDFSR